MSARPHPSLARIAASGSRQRRLSFFARLGALWSLRRQRERLSLLDDRLLEDIGLNREEAAEESGRAFWDAPLHWRH